MQLGGPKEIKEIHGIQHKIQFDEPANIQFTSVNIYSTAVAVETDS